MTHNSGRSVYEFWLFAGLLLNVLGTACPVVTDPQQIRHGLGEHVLVSRTLEPRRPKAEKGHPLKTRVPRVLHPNLIQPKPCRYCGSFSSRDDRLTKALAVND